MSIQNIKNALAAALTDRKINWGEADKIIKAALDEGGVTPEEKAFLDELRRTNSDSFDFLGRIGFDFNLRRVNVTQPNPSPVQPEPVRPEPTPVVPTEPERASYAARNEPWTTTYWPMAGNGGENVTDGSASSHLWAKDGALDKLDALNKARGNERGAKAREHELKPALNWLLGNSDIMKGDTRRAEKGEFIPNSSLSESDAERTTGVDFNGNGKLDADVKWDFVDAHGQFGTDGKTESTLDVGWWGSCDKVARAGILFQEPKKDVTVDGVTFTAQDIKGLLTVIADSQGGGSDFVGQRYDARPDVVTLRSGERLYGKITSEVDWNLGGKTHADGDFMSPKTLPEAVTIKLMDGTEKTVKREELRNVARENKRDDAAVFHTTIPEWLKSGRAAVMDKDSGDHVWNYNFYKADDVIYKDGLKPSWAPAELKDGHNGPAGDGKITYVERTVELGGGGGTEHYRYWLEEKNGKVVNSGWVSGASPDFLWRPSTEAAFTGANPRNPFVDPKLVKELYERSIAP